MSELAGQNPEQQRRVSYEAATRILHDSRRWAALADRFRDLVAEKLSESVEVSPGVTWGVYAQDAIWNSIDGVEERVILMAHCLPVPPEDGSQQSGLASDVVPGIRINSLSSVPMPGAGGESKKVYVMEDWLLPSGDYTPYHRFDVADIGDDGFAQVRRDAVKPFEFGLSDENELYVSHRVMSPLPVDSFTMTSALSDDRHDRIYFTNPHSPQELWGLLAAGSDVMARIQDAEPLASGYLEE